MPKNHIDNIVKRKLYIYRELSKGLFFEEEGFQEENEPFSYM